MISLYDYLFICFIGRKKGWKTCSFVIGIMGFYQLFIKNGFNQFCLKQMVLNYIKRNQFPLIQHDIKLLYDKLQGMLCISYEYTLYYLSRRFWVESLNMTFIFSTIYIEKRDKIHGNLHLLAISNLFHNRTYKSPKEYLGRV
jgi:hypothetical protein